MIDAYKNSDEFLELLYKKYTILFKTEPPCTNCVPVGWQSIVDNLCNNLESICKEMVYKGFNPIVVYQIKEKFAQLRFYIGSVDEKYLDRVDSLIAEATALSSKTCEVTGNAGRLYKDGGWLRTLSEEVIEEIEEVKKNANRIDG